MKWGLPGYNLLLLQINIIEENVEIKLFFNQKRDT